MSFSHFLKLLFDNRHVCLTHIKNLHLLDLSSQIPPTSIEIATEEEVSAYVPFHVRSSTILG